MTVNSLVLISFECLCSPVACRTLFPSPEGLGGLERHRLGVGLLGALRWGTL